MLDKILKKRRILIITDDEIKNLPLSSKTQCLVILGVFAFVSWVSFSSGKFFTYQQVIEQKEEEVQQANLINLDLQTKIDNLQGNLVRLNEYFNTVREFDHNKGKKKKKDKEVSFLQLPKIDKPFGKYNFKKRLSFNMKANVVEDINVNAVNRINNIKKMVSMTGLSVSDVSHSDKDSKEVLSQVFDSVNQGGPNTENVTTLDYETKNVDDNLYFSENIEQLMYLENLFNSVPFSSPMKRYYISSRYGNRVDPMTKRKAYHYGMDFAGPVGANVYSTAPGIVKFAGRKGNYGKFVEIDHGFNIVTRYGHLGVLKVSKGDQLARGTVIGYQGSTGRSSGPHLHYEVRFDDQHYNPEKFIRAGKYVF